MHNLDTPATSAAEKRPLDTYVILFAVALLAYLAGFLIPSGFFDTPPGASLSPDQYRQAADTAGGMALFGAGTEPGFLNFLLKAWCQAPETEQQLA